MPKNGRVAAVPPASVRRARERRHRRQHAQRMRLDEPGRLAQRLRGRRARPRRRRRQQHLQGQAGERAGRHDDEVALARQHPGHGAEHQAIERMRAAEVEARDDAGPAAGGAFCVLLGQGVETVAQRRHLLGEGLRAGIDLGPLGALARQRPHEALARADQDGNQRLVGPQQRLRLGQPQRFRVGERHVGREGPDDLGARFPHLASRRGRCRCAARCGAQ